jgi:hypothetical protein
LFGGGYAGVGNIEVAPDDSHSFGHFDAALLEIRRRLLTTRSTALPVAA